MTQLLFQAFWNKYAQLYDAVLALEPYQQLLNKSVDLLELNVNKKLKVLDAGCGTGNLIKAILAIRPHSVVGIDRSSAMLARAGDKLKYYHDVAEIKLADLNSRLPFNDGSFDRVALVNVLYTVQNIEAVLNEIRRVLKGDGRLIIANPVKNPKIDDILNAHITATSGSYKPHRLFLFLIKNPAIVALILANFFIIKRVAAGGQFHFLFTNELQTKLNACGMRMMCSDTAYGGTDVIVVAKKNFLFKAKDGRDISVEFALDKQELREIARLRYEVYCYDMKSLDPGDYPEKEEYDDYDKHSVHLLARDGVRLIAAYRMIRDNPSGFLMEQSFKLPSHIDRAKTLEHSRAVVSKEYRDLGIYSSLWDTALCWHKENGYTTCIGAATMGKFDSILSHLGWKQIGEPQSYHNISAMPVLYQLQET